VSLDPCLQVPVAREHLGDLLQHARFHGSDLGSASLESQLRLAQSHPMTLFGRKRTETRERLVQSRAIDRVRDCDGYGRGSRRRRLLLGEIRLPGKDGVNPRAVRIEARDLGFELLDLALHRAQAGVNLCGVPIRLLVEHRRRRLDRVSRRDPGDVRGVIGQCGDGRGLGPATEMQQETGGRCDAERDGGENRYGSPRLL
jgi:hypothetical protein